MLYIFSYDKGSTVQVHALLAIAVYVVNERLLKLYFLKPHYRDSFDHTSQAEWIAALKATPFKGKRYDERLFPPM